MKFTKIIAFGLCLLLLGLIFGCVGKQKQRQTIEFYNLHYTAPGPFTQSPLPFIIFIEKFKSVPPYDSTRIIFSKNDFTQNKYYYHQWIMNPDEMITHLMARDLRESKIARAILVSDNLLATHHLKGIVEQFYEQDLKDQWNAVLSITITMSKKNESDAARRICYQKNYKAISPCEEKNPQGLARAMSMAMSEISEMIISDTYEVLSAKKGNQSEESRKTN
jgi:cholesterol transport system auxiliary component